MFTLDGKQEREMDRQLCAASVVKQDCHGEAGVELEGYVPTLTYGHELWVVTERTRLQVQAAEMSFLCRVAGLSLRDRVRSSDI